ncbi:hypothetical protein [uncultured Gordonia sp.]|uniref:hypothetical protein n=1 Tax=uncultured Gordonia sp. TaxID=198437 RepID=UPI00258DA8CC|nr:hypothetical protein [uncultured Gordonia sp.]
MSARHSVEHDYLTRHYSETLERLYDRWGLGDYEVARRYVGTCAHGSDESFVAGVRAGTEALDQVPGPMVGRVAAALLRVTPDAEDDPVYDAGFRTALRLVDAGIVR